MAEKTVIYQVLPRLYGNRNRNPRPRGTKRENGCGKFSSFTCKRLGEIKSLGATHIWYTGVLEHATGTDYSRWGIAGDNPLLVKGLAGSPYAIKDYYDVDPDLADSVDDRRHEFQLLVARTHRCGLKVIVDFVPNHVARQYHSDAAPAGVGDFGQNDDVTKCFSPQNNFYYIENSTFAAPRAGEGQAQYSESPARATGNDCFRANPGEFDWYDTVKLNYGVDYMAGGARHFEPVPDTWKRMHAILAWWCAMGVDAFRCDMSEMVPVEFWHWATGLIKRDYPHVEFIAEIYNPAVYESYVNYGGFDYLYDKVGLYDKLRSVVTGKCPAYEIQRSWQSLGSLQPHMLNFLENHDEQRLASDFFAGDARKGRAPMAVAALMNTNPVMVYFGQEYGERGMDAEGYSGTDGRTSIYDYWSVEKIRKALFTPGELAAEDLELRDFYARLLGGACQCKAVAEGKFFDLTYCNLDDWARYPADRMYSFLRKAGDELLLVAANFSAAPVTAYVRIPQHAFDYLEIAPDTYKCCDLLARDDNEGSAHLAAEGKVRVTVEPWGAVALRFFKQ